MANRAVASKFEECLKLVEEQLRDRPSEGVFVIELEADRVAGTESETDKVKQTRDIVFKTVFELLDKKERLKESDGAEDKQMKINRLKEKLMRMENELHDEKKLRKSAVEKLVEIKNLCEGEKKHLEDVQTELEKEKQLRISAERKLATVPDIVKLTPGERQELFNYVCKKGETSKVKTLIGLGFDVNSDDGDDRTRTPLVIAVKCGHADVVKALLDNGARADVKATEKQLTPLHIAVVMGHLEVLHTLLEAKVNVDEPAKDGRTALHLAAGAGELGCGKALVSSGANVSTTDDEQIPPLQYAAMYGHDDMCTLLLESGADVHQRGRRGLTALHFAAFQGHLSIVQLLVKSKADVTLKDASGKTALDSAVSEGKTEVITYLKQLSEH